MSEEIEVHPVQRPHTLARDRSVVPKVVSMRAYEVYCAVYGPQPALVDTERDCRGGFGVSELIAFLYARSFPQAEWRMRTEEAFKGMKNL